MVRVFRSSVSCSGHRSSLIFLWKFQCTSFLLVRRYFEQGLFNMNKMFKNMNIGITLHLWRYNPNRPQPVSACSVPCSSSPSSTIHYALRPLQHRPRICLSVYHVPSVYQKASFSGFCRPLFCAQSEAVFVSLQIPRRDVTKVWYLSLFILLVFRNSACDILSLMLFGMGLSLELLVKNDFVPAMILSFRRM